jgi:hypothetical protein
MQICVDGNAAVCRELRDSYLVADAPVVLLLDQIVCEAKSLRCWGATPVPR